MSILPPQRVCNSILWASHGCWPCPCPFLLLRECVNLLCEPPMEHQPCPFLPLRECVFYFMSLSWNTNLVPAHFHLSASVLHIMFLESPLNTDLGACPFLPLRKCVIPFVSLSWNWIVCPFSPLSWCVIPFCEPLMEHWPCPHQISPSRKYIILFCKPPMEHWPPCPFFTCQLVGNSVP